MTERSKEIPLVFKRLINALNTLDPSNEEHRKLFFGNEMKRSRTTSALTTAIQAYLNPEQIKKLLKFYGDKRFGARRASIVNELIGWISLVYHELLDYYRESEFNIGTRLPYILNFLVSSITTEFDGYPWRIFTPRGLHYVLPRYPIPLEGEPEKLDGWTVYITPSARELSKILGCRFVKNRRRIPAFVNERDKLLVIQQRGLYTDYLDFLMNTLYLLLYVYYESKRFLQFTVNLRYAARKSEDLRDSFEEWCKCGYFELLPLLDEETVVVPWFVDDVNTALILITNFLMSDEFRGNDLLEKLRKDDVYSTYQNVMEVVTKEKWRLHYWLDILSSYFNGYVTHNVSKYNQGVDFNFVDVSRLPQNTIPEIDYMLKRIKRLRRKVILQIMPYTLGDQLKYLMKFMKEFYKKWSRSKIEVWSPLVSTRAGGIGPDVKIGELFYPSEVLVFPYESRYSYLPPKRIEIGNPVGDESRILHVLTVMLQNSGILQVIHHLYDTVVVDMECRYLPEGSSVGYIVSDNPVTGETLATAKIDDYYARSLKLYENVFTGLKTLL